MDVGRKPRKQEQQRQKLVDDRPPDVETATVVPAAFETRDVETAGFEPAASGKRTRSGAGHSSHSTWEKAWRMQREFWSGGRWDHVENLACNEASFVALASSS